MKGNSQRMDMGSIPGYWSYLLDLFSLQFEYQPFIFRQVKELIYMGFYYWHQERKYHHSLEDQPSIVTIISHLLMDQLFHLVFLGRFPLYYQQDY